MQYLNGSIDADGFLALMAPIYEIEPTGNNIYLVGLVIAILAYLWFNVRAMSNLKAFSSRHVPGSLTGVVLWQFVPILQLVTPA